MVSARAKPSNGLVRGEQRDTECDENPHENRRRDVLRDVKPACVSDDAIRNRAALRERPEVRGHRLRFVRGRELDECAQDSGCEENSPRSE